MIGLIKGTARQAKTVSGLPLPIATYNGNLKAPIKKLSLSINPTQSGSGDPAPDNIRPITGVSSVDVNNSGDNIYTTEGIWAISAANITVISTDSFRIQRASAWSSTKQSNTSLGIEVGKMYCLVCDVEYTSGTAYIAIRNSSNAIQSGTGKIFESKKVYFYFTLANSTDYLSFFCSFNESVGDVTYRNIRLYEIKTNYNLPLGGTYYGGTIDIVDGEAIFTMKYVKSIVDKTMLKSYNSSSMVFATSGGKRIVRMRNFLYYTTTGAKEGYYCRAIKWAGEIFCISNIFSNIHINNRGYMSSQTWTDFIVPDTVTDYASWQSFIQDLIDNNVDVEFCYEYSTADPGYPTEVQLSPTQINSLLGQNNIWHDGNGDVEVLKFMDRQLYFGR